MSLNSTPVSERLHISFFGRRNAGKSSLINALTGQKLSIVSDKKGTTTDPVKKTMELLPLGPVVIIDTAGIDDEGELGKLRIEKTLQVLDITDIAVVVTDGETGIGKTENDLIQKLKAKKIPYIICYNKNDLFPYTPLSSNEVSVSAETGKGMEAFKELLGKFNTPKTAPLVSDLIEPGDTVVLVVPIDEAAPKGRLILPQQMVIRDILDSGAIAVTLQPNELPVFLGNCKTPPALVICDSQVFGKAAALTPENIPLTSFSILMLRYKLGLEGALKAADALDKLRDGDRILISEGCTHHRQCGDIGTVKLPALVKKYTGKDINFEFTSGGDFPADVSGYAMVIHCGGCMLSDRAVQARMLTADGQNVPFTNYGIILSKTQGTLDRSVEIFK